jgi:YVTN family beta-propeller protein
MGIAQPIAGNIPMCFARVLVPILLFVASAPVRADIAIVLNSADQTVSLVDTVAYKELSRIPVGKEPHHLMATPDDRQLIVANAISNELVFLDPMSGQIINRLKNISDPYQIGFSPDKKWFVSNSLRLDRVDIYRGEDFALVKRLPAPKTPSHLAFDRASQFVFVTLQQSNEVMAIDLAKQETTWTMPVGKQPAGIWMTPDDKYLLVAMTGDDYVEAYDWRTRTSVKKLRTGKGAHNFQARGDGRHVFLSNRMANTISVIDQQALAVVDTIEAPGGPDDLEVTRDGKQLWYTGRFSRKLWVIDLDTKKVVQSIPVGRSPHGVYFHTHAPRK